jgi:hypothetical protein
MGQRAGSCARGLRRPGRRRSSLLLGPVFAVIASSTVIIGPLPCVFRS